MSEVALQMKHSSQAYAYPLKVRRATTGSVAGSGQAEITVAWETPFADTNYSVIATVEEGTAATDTLKVLKVASKTPEGVVIRVQNVNATARTGTLHVLGLPDGAPVGGGL